jgi:CelD/BcsL family acetyltransferase involved in cellulose biosynthesis
VTLGRNLKSQIVRPRDLSAMEVDLWESFCRADASLHHPFFSSAFARAVDRVRPDVFVAVLRDRDRTVGFFPFQFSRPIAMAMRAAERVGGLLSDRCGLIADQSLRLPSSQLLGLSRLRSFSYAYMPTEQLHHGFAADRLTIGQHVRLSGDSASFWTALKTSSRKFVTQLERKERVLERELGPLRMMFEADPMAELPRLIEQKRAQYRRTGVDDVLTAPWTHELFLELHRTANRDCRVAVSTLYAGDTWLATHLGIMSEDVFHHWFPVHNPDWHRCSPGHILTKHLLFSAFAAGISWFDFGGYCSYKGFFRPEQYHMYAGFLPGPGIGGRANQALQSLVWRIDALKRGHSGQPARKEVAG